VHHSCNLVGKPNQSAHVRNSPRILPRPRHLRGDFWTFLASTAPVHWYIRPFTQRSKFFLFCCSLHTIEYSEYLPDTKPSLHSRHAFVAGLSLTGCCNRKYPTVHRLQCPIETHIHFPGNFTRSVHVKATPRFEFQSYYLRLSIWPGLRQTQALSPSGIAPSSASRHAPSVRGTQVESTLTQDTDCMKQIQPAPSLCHTPLQYCRITSLMFVTIIAISAIEATSPTSILFLHPLPPNKP
jgi:hypothetical protein